MYTPLAMLAINLISINYTPLHHICQEVFKISFCLSAIVMAINTEHIGLPTYPSISITSFYSSIRLLKIAKTVYIQPFHGNFPHTVCSIIVTVQVVIGKNDCIR